MYTKITQDGNRVIIKRFQSWYDVAYDHFIQGVVFTFVGLLGLIILPYIVILSIVKPNCVSTEERLKGD